jgi:CheY-like chemotaxis protein
MPTRDAKYLFLILEDRPNSPEWMEFSEYFNKHYRDDVDLVRCSSPLKFVGALRQLSEKAIRPDLIVIDIMIPDVTSLISVGLTAATGNGFLAGLVFARDWLRHAGNGFETVPLLFWTALQRTDQIKRNIEALERIAPVGYVTKNTPSQWTEIETFLSENIFRAK